MGHLPGRWEGRAEELPKAAQVDPWTLAGSRGGRLTHFERRRRRREETSTVRGGCSEYTIRGKAALWVPAAQTQTEEGSRAAELCLLERIGVLITPNGAP